MTTNLHNMPQADDLPFDQLVDGELSEEKRRELLAGLDNEPGGWRRCALAFLESQCWKQTIITLREGEALRESEAPAEPNRLPLAAVAPARQEPRPPQEKNSPWQTKTGTLLAMAASFLVALGLGLWAQRFRPAQPGTPVGVGITNQFAATPAGRQPAALPSNRTPNPWRLVTVSDGRNPAASFNLPAVERDNVDQQWLQSLPPAIPDNVLQALSRTGHQIQQRRELIPVPLQDGRQLVMPVDQVEVHYVGNKTY